MPLVVMRGIKLKLIQPLYSSSKQETKNPTKNKHPS